MHENFLFQISECTGSGDCIQSYTSETISWPSFAYFPPFRVNINASLRSDRPSMFHRATVLFPTPAATHASHSQDRRAGPQLNPVRHIACTAAVHAAFHTDISLLLICIFHLRRIR